MEYNFDNIRPIYIQIIEYVKLDIISNRLKKGDKIPSVREYALQMKVNPNTVQKALVELERDGLIYTERTNGKYVTNDDALINKIKEANLYEMSPMDCINLLDELKKIIK